MSKVTKAEKWFGKKKNDLTSEELKEFWRLEAKERRKLPKVQEYRKQYQKQYQKDNKEKINQSIKEWKQNNPEKVKSYRYAKLNREIEVLKKSLKETTDLMQNYLMENLELQEKLANKENEHIKDKLYLLEFLKANFADVYIYGVMKIDNYDRVKYSKDVNDIVDREIRKLNGEW